MLSLCFDRLRASPWAGPGPAMTTLLVLALLLLTSADTFAHAVTQGDNGYIQEISGVHL